MTDKEKPLQGKKLMILGGGASQLPLITAARRHGIRTIVVSTPGDWPCLKEADEISLTDISDPEAVLQAATDAGIDGIVTCCMDTGVPALGRVCDALGLPGPSYEAASTARNKYRMKEAFQKVGVPCARHRKVSGDQDLEVAMQELGFPLVLKAVDQMGSRGIYLCRDREAVRHNYPEVLSQTREDYCLAEEFLEGELFDGEGMLQNGRMVFTLLDNSLLMQAHVPTSIGHSWPWKHQEEAGAEAVKQLEAAARALGLDNTAFDCDLMYRDGKVYVIELNARAGASSLPEIIGRTWGIDYYEVLVLLAMGMDVAPFFRSTTGLATAAGMIFSTEDLSSARIRVEEDKLPPVQAFHQLELHTDHISGDPVRAYTNGRDSLGHILVSAPSLQEAESLLRQSLQAVRIEP